MIKGPLDKAAVFATANAFLRRLILWQVGVGKLEADALSMTQRNDLKGELTPVDVEQAHEIQALLEVVAMDPGIVALYVRIVAPRRGDSYNPVELLDQFIASCRAELALAPLTMRDGGWFSITLPVICGLRNITATPVKDNDSDAK
jgi:hypothetical protein